MVIFHSYVMLVYQRVRQTSSKIKRLGSSSSPCSICRRHFVRFHIHLWRTSHIRHSRSASSSAAWSDSLIDGRHSGVIKRGHWKSLQTLGGKLKMGTPNINKVYSWEKSSMNRGFSSKPCLMIRMYHEIEHVLQFTICQMASIWLRYLKHTPHKQWLQQNSR